MKYHPDVSDDEEATEKFKDDKQKLMLFYQMMIKDKDTIDSDMPEWMDSHKKIYSKHNFDDIFQGFGWCRRI